uniref:Integrase, catalytic region, zinc finger, CCHC-type, peptidase aspartic, catalytic n=1 Tax=Tanacetum cinerariifolium TaxID=118510 RepID=A0A6L2N6G6_TANCI|nr:integrase, catalytic region, zinc finger, CCHC-type, peptidase aspartic, catalytic [Tanacetum cinerariifolium]
MILESVENGPLIWPTIEENGVTKPKKYSELSATEATQADCDDPIDAINHMMSFLSTVVTSCYPTTNNQLRNSSNPRQQATINDGRANLSHYGSDALAEKAQQLEPKLYDGNVIKTTCAIMIPDSEETLMLAEESHSKMILKQQDPMVLEKKQDPMVLEKKNSMNSSDPNLSKRPTTVEVPKKLPKVSMTYKQLYDSIKSTLVRSKEQTDALINQANLKSVEISDLNANLQEQGTTTVQHSKLDANSKLICVKCNGCMLFDNHDLCVPNVINDVNTRAKSKSVKKNSKRKVWKPTGKLVEFHNDDFDPFVSFCCSFVSSNQEFQQEGLGYNLFSVGQFCDLNLEFAFRQHTCYIRNLEGVDLLTESQGNNLYTLSLGDMMVSSPICFLSKASKTKSWIWHQRLSHLNFDYELTAMASEHSSSGPALHEMTPATISLGLVPNPPPSTPFVPPSRTDWDRLFQPLFDELLTPSPSVDHPSPKVIAPIADVVASEPVASIGSPSSTTVNQDAPSSKGFVDQDNPSHMYKLKKALYGLKQAPHACWSSKKQKYTTISSTKAEYIALSGCCAQILWTATTKVQLLYALTPFNIQKPSTSIQNRNDLPRDIPLDSVEVLRSSQRYKSNPNVSDHYTVFIRERKGKEIYEHKNEDLHSMLGEPLAGVTTRRVRDSEAASVHECLYVNFLSEIKPKRLIEALEEEGCVIAINKMNENEILIKNKARLVSQRFRQEEGIDYDETFSPVTRLKAIRIFLTYATYMGFMVYQKDVKKPMQSLFPPSGDMNVDDIVDKSLSENNVQPVTQPKAKIDKKSRKKKNPSFSKPKTIKVVKESSPSLQVADTQPTEEPGAALIPPRV